MVLLSDPQPHHGAAFHYAVACAIDDPIQAPGLADTDGHMHAEDLADDATRPYCSLVSYGPALALGLPGSKSITNRVWFWRPWQRADRCSAARLRVTIRGDAALSQALGIGVEVADDGRQMTVHGGLSRLQTPESAMFVGNSGTTVRFGRTDRFGRWYDNAGWRLYHRPNGRLGI